MTDDIAPEFAELEQQLLNERRERDIAQRRAAELFDRVALWRKRAEDRAVRIKKLEAERDKLRNSQKSSQGLLRRKRRATPSQPGPQGTLAVVEAGTPVHESEPLSDISFPGVKCASALKTGDLITAMSVFDTASIGPTTALMDADVVIVDAAGFRSLDGVTVDSVIEWASVSGRPPLIVTADVDKRLSVHAQGILATDDISGRFFSPSKWNPRTKGVVDDALANAASIVEVNGYGTVATEPFDPLSTVHLELAAAGTPFLPDGVEIVSLDTLERAGVQYRRFAYEHRARELERLMSQLTIDVPKVEPSVAGVVVSNRPDDLGRALLQLTKQRVGRFEVVIGCHGFSSSIVQAEIDQLAASFPVSVREFDSGVSLGACLNEAVASTGADIIAKLDDDDHYGPSYLVDAVHALEYGGTPVIGKGTTFTFMESLDRTVVRRPGNEERISRGSPTGATLVWRRWLWERNPFAHRSLGEDVGFLRGARLLGFDIYINSRFEFVYHRRRTGNTWQAADELFLEGAVEAWEGEHPERADVPNLEFDLR